MKYKMHIEGEWAHMFDVLRQFEQIAKDAAAESIVQIYKHKNLEVKQGKLRNFMNLFRRMHTLDAKYTFEEFQARAENDTTVSVSKQIGNMLVGYISREKTEDILKGWTERNEKTGKTYNMDSLEGILPFSIGITDTTRAHDLKGAIVVSSKLCAINLTVKGEFNYVGETVSKRLQEYVENTYGNKSGDHSLKFNLTSEQNGNSV